METRGYDVGAAELRIGAIAFARGRRSRDGHPVLLARPAQHPAGRTELEILEREWHLLRDLAVPGVPRALDFLPAADTACLVLDDRGLEPLRVRMPSRRQDLSWFFRAALAICSTLGEIHRRHIVYGGLAPSSILVGGDGGDVELLDFSLALTDGEERAPGDPLPGHRAPYVSPEQTGRTNRTVDHRADLYSLGAVFYEMLTGAPPFRSSDPLELVHAHIARTPVSPDLVASGIPSQVSRIVMKLLAKAAEDRYQSAAGLAADLAACQREWNEAGRVTFFDLARRDVSERFTIPQRLYGREREIAELESAFRQTCEGRPTLMLVAGYSGIGKSSLIGELYRPIVRERGYFLSGKLDQVARNTPYGALLQAFRSLLSQVLALNEEQLSDWRARIGNALGTNGGVLAEVLPEIQYLLGPQPSAPALNPAEAQNRFRFVFQSFVGAVARKDHPLVLFLDDLQWVDPATLDLLYDLLTAPDIRYLLVLGTYRDNEVDAAHPLSATIARLKDEGASVLEIALGPLSADAISALLAETLQRPARDTAELASLIVSRTDGNPFFVTQFLTTLHQEGVFRFDRAKTAWTFDLDAIAAADTSENVGDFMVQKIRRLSPRAQTVITLGAAIGGRFDWQTYLAVSRQTDEEAAAGLAEALGAGLLRPAVQRFESSSPPAEGPLYAFHHDRVQQAAYDVLAFEERTRLHLDVGQYLLNRYGPEMPDERLFDVVNHLNLGRAFVRTAGDEPDSERLAVARLNLAAGRKAKLSAAYQAAAAYLSEGILLVHEQDWASDYTLLFALHLEAAECEYLAGRFERAEHHFDLLVARAHSSIERAEIYSRRTVLYENQSRYPDAVRSAREGLALLGVVLPEQVLDIDAAVEAEIARIEARRGSRTIAALVDLPLTTSAEHRMIMRILTTLWAPAYLSGNERLTRLVSATMVRLSLEHGSTEDFAYGCVTHAITIGPVRRDYASAYSWGELALALNERFDDTKRRAKIHQQFHAHVKLWRRPFESCIPHAREAQRAGLASGDFTYAGYGAVTETWPAFLTSRNLDLFVREYSPSLALLDRIRMADFHQALTVVLNWARALQGRTAGPLSLSDPEFDEDVFLQTYRDRAPFFLTFLHTAHLHLGVLHGRYDEAIRAANAARAVVTTGTIWPVLIEFWGALAIAGAWSRLGQDEREAAFGQLTTAATMLGELADNCPENFRGAAWLVSSEIHALQGRIDEAVRLAEDALDYASALDDLQLEALASERAARQHEAAGRRDRAGDLLRRAHRCYAAWGAAAKVRQLEEAAGELLTDGAGAPRRMAAASHAAGTQVAIDVASVLKVARAIAVEIELDELLRKLMKIAIENAGATRGLFLIERDGRMVVEAEATADSEQVRIRSAGVSATHEGLNLSVVRFVHRTGQDVVVRDVGADDRFAGDPYAAHATARSILCVPVVHQGRSGGLLYLENSLTDAFTPERAEMMRILATQAAISLENARLYDGMKAEVERRTVAETSLRDALNELEALKNQLEAENVYLQEEIRTQHNFNEIVGNSSALLAALRKVEAVAETESTVLIVGETGSGKELFARAVHSRSRRSGRPLVKVNCGAIAPGLVESELFGHVKGAFTGAIDKRIGRFEVANGGTILLDEIGELPLDAQVKLLRVLQEQEFEPVGSSRTVKVDVRIIAATNRDLEQSVREGSFRADLLYRLNVFPIEVPPLRARTSDVPLLVALFVTGLNRKLGKPFQGFSARAMERLMAYTWPGNVRELQNVVERAAILARTPVLELDPAFAVGATAAGHTAASVREDTLDNIQRTHIEAVLKMTGGVVEGAKGAATILGLHPNTLRSRMKKLGIGAGR